MHTAVGGWVWSSWEGGPSSAPPNVAVCGGRYNGGLRSYKRLVGGYFVLDSRGKPPKFAQGESSPLSPPPPPPPPPPLTPPPPSPSCGGSHRRRRQMKQTGRGEGRRKKRKRKSKASSSWRSERVASLLYPLEKRED